MLGGSGTLTLRPSDAEPRHTPRAPESRCLMSLRTKSFVLRGAVDGMVDKRAWPRSVAEFGLMRFVRRFGRMK